VKKKHTSREDYERLAEINSEEVNLPIALDNHFKFLVLLTQEADPFQQRLSHKNIKNTMIYINP